MIMQNYTKYRSFLRCMLYSACFILMVAQPALSQQAATGLEERVKSLENYVATLEQALMELSESLNVSMDDYTQKLSSSF